MRPGRAAELHVRQKVQEAVQVRCELMGRPGRKSLLCRQEHNGDCCMIKNKYFVLLFTAVATTVCPLGWLACSVNSSVSETDLIADSSLVWYEFPSGNADYRILSVTVACRQGKPAAVVKLERWREVATYQVPLTLESYVRLWRVLLKNAIWELPSGEFWPYLELLEARGSFFRVSSRYR